MQILGDPRPFPFQGVLLFCALQLKLVFPFFDDPRGRAHGGQQQQRGQHGEPPLLPKMRRNEVVERRRNRHVAENPPAAEAAVPQADLIERRAGLEMRGQAVGLAFFGRALRQVGFIQTVTMSSPPGTKRTLNTMVQWMPRRGSS